MNAVKRAIIPIFIPHLACPHRCVFCDQTTISGSIGCPSSMQVKETIERYLETIPKGRLIEVAFFGGSFTGIPTKQQEGLLSVAQNYLRIGKIHNIRVSTRPDYIDKARLELLTNFGVNIIEIGVQSLDDSVLAKSGRGHSKEQSIYAFQLIKEQGFQLGIQLMPGLPGSNDESDMDTVLNVIELRPDFCRVYPTLVIKGTLLHRMYNQGKYRPMSLEQGINRVKRVTAALYIKEIPVIRIGLHPSKQLEDALLGGPYHPAFGDLIKGRMFYDLQRLGIIGLSGSVRIISGNPLDIAAIKGFKKINIVRLQNEFNLKFKIVSNEKISRDSIEISSNNGKMCRYDLLQLFRYQYN